MFFAIIFCCWQDFLKWKFLLLFSVTRLRQHLFCTSRTLRGTTPYDPWLRNTDWGRKHSSFCRMSSPKATSWRLSVSIWMLVMLCFCCTCVLLLSGCGRNILPYLAILLYSLNFIFFLNWGYLSQLWYTFYCNRGRFICGLGMEKLKNKSTFLSSSSWQDDRFRDL